MCLRGYIDSRLSSETQKLQQIISNLDKDIVDLKREIRDRDDVVAEREKRINKHKRKAIELEKNR